MCRNDVELFLGIDELKKAIHHFNYNGDTYIAQLDSIVEDMVDNIPYALENNKLNVNSYLELLNRYTQLVNVDKMVIEINDKFNTYIDKYLCNYTILAKIIRYDKGNKFMELLNSFQLATKEDYADVVSFSSMTSYHCKICKTKDMWGNSNVPDICLNCSGKFIREMFKHM